MDQATQALMQQMADDAAGKAVRHTFVTLGMNPDAPIEAQRDMAALRELRGLVESEDFQKDLIHLRRWRKTIDSVESKGVLAVVALVCTGGIGLLVYVFKLKFGS